MYIYLRINRFTLLSFLSLLCIGHVDMVLRDMSTLRSRICDEGKQSYLYIYIYIYICIYIYIYIYIYVYAYKMY